MTLRRMFGYIMFSIMPSACFSQHECYPCLKLQLAGSKSRIQLDSIWYYKIFYTLENCGDQPLHIDTLDIPNFENNDQDRINFQFYHTDSGGYFKLFHTEPRDVQVMFDPTKSSYLDLMPNKKFVYAIKLFRFYEIKMNRGTYRIHASYRIPLEHEHGYYLQQSENYIELQIE